MGGFAEIQLPRVFVEKSVSGTDGKVLFQGLWEGAYRIRETKIPTGYKQANDFELILKVNQDAKILDFYEKADVSKTLITKVTNETKRGMISFTKVGRFNELCADKSAGVIDPSAKIGLEGAEFTLYEEAKPEAPIGTAKSDKDGKVLFQNIKEGRYLVRETAGVNGYTIDDTLYYAQVKEAGFDGLTLADGTAAETNQVVNEVYRTNIRMKKVNEKNTSEPVEGSTYGRYRYAGSKARAAETEDIKEEDIQV